MTPGSHCPHARTPAIDISRHNGDAPKDQRWQHQRLDHRDKADVNDGYERHLFTMRPPAQRMNGCPLDADADRDT